MLVVRDGGMEETKKSLLEQTFTGGETRAAREGHLIPFASQRKSVELVRPQHGIV